MSHRNHSTPSAPRRIPARRRAALCTALIVTPLMVGLAACSGGPPPLADTPYDAADQVSFGAAGGEDAADVDPAKPLKVTAKDEGARITDVTAVDAAGRLVSGELAADGSSWTSTTPLTAGVRYTVHVSTENADGRPGRRTHEFGTKAADQDRLEVTFGPEKGTYGVGQPVTAELSQEITDPAARAAVERGLRVESEPGTRGSWYWVDDKLLHYRPPEYWPAHATVTVRSVLDGVPIQDGLRGGENTELTIRTGDRVEAVADISTLTMTFKRNGETVRTMPITTGKAGFRTRSGKKVVLGRQSYVRMRSTSIGISGGADFYDLDVYWAARLTWSGEYVHGAPWSTGSHGYANVSHGCTGLSTSNARWFFENVRPGDVVEHVNGYGTEMPHFGNGFGDWNMEWDQWREGSALHAGTGSGGGGPAEAARLRPQI